MLSTYPYICDMKFKDIPGHDEVKRLLRSMVDNRKIPHALLLEGPQGVGKLAMARAMAQYIHCTDRQSDGEPCGRCPSCIQHQAFNHIDTHYVYPVVKLDRMTTAPVSADFATEWHEFLEISPFADYDRWVGSMDKKNARAVIYVTESAALLHVLNLTTHGSEYRVVILWLPEKMNEESANKLLKIIEEPFEDTIFIMTSDNPAEILPTVYSRLQRVSMKRLPDNVLATFLEQHYGVSADDAASIARLARGSVTEAERMLDTRDERHEFLDMFMQLMRLAYQRKVRELREWGNTLAGWGRERELKFYEYCQRMIRENFVSNFGVGELVYLNREEAAFSVNFARFINERNVERIISVMDNAMIDIAGNANGKIVNLDTAIKIILLLKQ